MSVFLGRPGPRFTGSTFETTLSDFLGRPGPRFTGTAKTRLSDFLGRPGPRFTGTAETALFDFLGRPGPRFTGTAKTRLSDFLGRPGRRFTTTLGRRLSDFLGRPGPRLMGTEDTTEPATPAVVTSLTVLREIGVAAADDAVEADGEARTCKEVDPALSPRECRPSAACGVRVGGRAASKLGVGLVGVPPG